MINLHERMLPNPAGLESATSSSPVGRASDWATDWLCWGLTTSTLEGHFVSSPREREKRDRRDSRRDKKERDREERGNWATEAVLPWSAYDWGLRCLLRPVCPNTEDKYPIGHVTFIQRRINVDASTLIRCCLNVSCLLGTLQCKYDYVWARLPNRHQI